TKNDLEAILLEHNLIKKYRPKFNILLKDDKTFPLIAIDKKHDFPAIFKHRGMKKKDFHYFGPFASGLDVKRVIDVLRKSFLLRNCSDSEFAKRTKPCLEYQIKKCSAPCVGFVSHQDYKNLITQTLDFLSGKSSQIQADLAAKMQTLSDEYEFEKAAILRDKIKSLSSIQAQQNINLKASTNIDVITLITKENKYCVYISFFRNGNNYGAVPYFYTIENENKSEFLEEFLGQFYLKQDPPSAIALNLEIENKNLLEEFLGKIITEKVKIFTPQKGDKARIIMDQEQIALDVLTQHIDKNLSEKKLLLELKEAFDLPKIPTRIEVYDNSHIATQNAVGAMIVAGSNGFIKGEYRKFNIRFDEDKNRDDTAMMGEVLRRRFRQMAVVAIHELPLPDLIIIDGGLPQLSAARKVFDEFNLSIPLICMAKGENRNAGDETYYKIDKNIIDIKKGSGLAFYLQRLRDEAHRFAINTHRTKRAKNMIKSTLDEISGIGIKRKKILLSHFGSIEKIKQASIKDLSRVTGINKKIATKIWEGLQK
ncbi:MAG TPA: excinuclease ABC subunit UvrC, partial [Rickettsiales bacterium]|nr:excinuclease ABC subunit UvrC [Rickettsiales bacterium]